MFRTGSRRDSEPLVFARAELKALFFECQGLIPACISQGYLYLAAFRVIRRVRYQRPITPPLTRQSAKRTDIRMAALEERTNGWPLALNGLSHTVSHPNWPGMKRKPGGPSGCITSVWVIAWFLAHLCDAVRAAGNAL